MLERQNKKIITFNQQLSNEYNKRKWQPETCTKCLSSLALLSCEKCEEPLCFSCRSICWICMHRGEKINIRTLKKEQKDLETTEKNNKKLLANTEEGISHFFNNKLKNEFGKFGGKYQRHKPREHSIIEKPYAVMKNLCKECVGTCVECGVSVCFSCKYCLCNVEKLEIEDPAPKKGKIKNIPSKITEAAELKQIFTGIAPLAKRNGDWDARFVPQHNQQSERSPSCGPSPSKRQKQSVL